MSPRIVILGAGGHAGVLIEALILSGGPLPLFALDQESHLWGHSILGIPVQGDLGDLARYVREQRLTHFINAVGSAGSTEAHQRVYEQGLSAGLTPFPVLHPGAICSPNATYGPGLQMAAGAILCVHAQVGQNVLINTGAIVEHDCKVGDHAHIATGAKLAGAVSVGAGAHIGIGACIRQGLTIGVGAIIAAGAVVIRDVEAGAVMAGVPAHRLKKPAQ